MQFNLSDITIDDSDIPNLDTDECAKLSTNRIILGGLASVPHASLLINEAVPMAMRALARKNPKFGERLGWPNVIEVNKTTDRTLCSAVIGGLIYLVDISPLGEQLQVNSELASSLITMLLEKDPAFVACQSQVAAVGQFFTHVNAKIRAYILEKRSASTQATSPF